MPYSISNLEGMLPREIIDSIDTRGIKTLTPPQELAVQSGLLKGRNMVVASPTASGKTLIAEMAMTRCTIGTGKKSVYIAPMRALTSEKYAEFKAAYPYLKVAISIGDLDSLDIWLEKYDMIFASTEKFDSLIRHGANWLSRIGCIVVDEVHMLGDSSRGPTLEVLISRLKRICPSAQIVALSATIGNANEIADWLDAELVTSDYRSVKLDKGVVLEDTVYYIDGEDKLKGTSKLSEYRILEDVLSRNKQMLSFYATKRNTEAGAERLAEIVKDRLTDNEKLGLEGLSHQILHVLGKPTMQCERLAACIAKGTAFHHSGLVNEQRKIIEDAFKSGMIKLICATTTLGLGVNLPANTVLVRDTTRFTGGGSEPIGVNEVSQLFGRAGRPGYDSHGIALLIARSAHDRDMMSRKYLMGKLEPVDSKLSILPVLRTHILSFIATDFLTMEASITAFFAETFYGYQYSSMPLIRSHVNRIIDELEEWQFIERKGNMLAATKLGARVSELYIDPMSARLMCNILERKERDDIANLFMIAQSEEMRPYVKETKDSLDKFSYYCELLQIKEENDYDTIEYYYPERAFSTAMLLYDWASEIPERDLVKKYGTTPGAVFSKVSNADWLLYAASEMARLIHVSPLRLIELRQRVRYGIKQELLDLIRLEQVGRVRARAMFNNGIRKVADLRNEGAEQKLIDLFGKEIALKIISQAESPAI